MAATVTYTGSLDRPALKVRKYTKARLSKNKVKTNTVQRQNCLRPIEQSSSTALSSVKIDA